jgi:hypothetical protein
VREPTVVPTVEEPAAEISPEERVVNWEPIEWPFPSSPPPTLPTYNMTIQCSLRVKKIGRVNEIKSLRREDFSLSSMEAAVNGMVSSSSLTTEGRPHTITDRRFAYKPDKAKATWQLDTLKDFSFEEEHRILGLMDNYCLRFKAPYAVDCKLEIHVDCEPLQKALSRTRYANEPSSPADGEATPVPGGRRTNQLLKEARAEQRVKIIRSAVDHVDSIHRIHECRVPYCDNY